jgi:translation elongation factor EF-1beta
MVVVNHAAYGKGALDQRQVQHRGHIGIRIAVGGHAVARLDVAFGDVELRLVGDVADDAGFGTGAEQRALRAFQNLDAVEVGGVDVEIAIRQLSGLVIEVNRHVRP